MITFRSTNRFTARTWSSLNPASTSGTEPRQSFYVVDINDRFLFTFGVNDMSLASLRRLLYSVERHISQTAKSLGIKHGWGQWRSFFIIVIQAALQKAKFAVWCQKWLSVFVAGFLLISGHFVCTKLYSFQLSEGPRGPMSIHARRGKCMWIKLRVYTKRACWRSCMVCQSSSFFELMFLLCC